MKQKQEGVEPYTPPKRRPAGTGPDSAGQSGDIQGLPDDADVNDESVTELIEEGQFYEAEVVAGVENAGNADAGPVRTRQVPEDDVPPEYRNPERPPDNT
jgi:hypothetical protein